MNAAIYSRQSKDKKESLSIETQIEKCIQLCNFKGKKYKLYSDKGFSGKNIFRPGFEEMLKDIKQGLIDEVIVYRLDRISRNLNDFTNMLTEFDSLGVTFASATESFDNSTPMGRAMMHILAVFAQLERENISERLKDNKAYTVGTLGKWNGGRAPFGYDLDPFTENNKTKFKMLINENESEIIRTMFDLYLQPNGSIRSVCINLNRMGYKTKTNLPFSTSRISQLLANLLVVKNSLEVYEYFKNGEFIIQNEKEEFDGKKSIKFFRHSQSKDYKYKKQDKFIVISEHEGIIDGKQWVQVQEKLELRKRISPRTNSSKRSFVTGIIKCGKCGSPMYISGAIKDLYYRCQKKIDAGKCICDNRNIRASRIDETVIEYLKTLCDDKNDIKSILLQKKKVNIEEELKKINKDINQIESVIREKQKELVGLVDNVKHIKNIKLLEAIENESERINNEIEKSYKLVEQLKIQRKTISDTDINYNNLLQNLMKFKNDFKSADFATKKAIIHGIVENVIIYPDKIEINIFYAY